MDFSSALSETFSLFECHFLMLLLMCSCWGVVYVLGKFHVNTELVLGQFMPPLWPLVWRILTCLVICISLHMLCLFIPGVIAAAVAPTLPLIVFPLLVVYVLDCLELSADCLLMIKEMLLVVSFRATLLADLLTSVPRVFSSLTSSWIILISAILGLEIKTVPWADLVSTLPFLIRFVQCVREGKLKSYMNAGKYVFSILSLVFQAFYAMDGKWEVALMYVATMSSLYSFTWDILFDMDMIGRWNNVRLYPHVNSHITHRVAFYFWFTLSDFVMRYAWYLRKVSGNHSLIAFGFALLELYRRLQWTVLRIEVEAAQQGPHEEHLQNALLG